MSKSKKTYSVRIQKEAIDELDHIYRFICRDSAGHASSFLKALKKKIMTLKEFPERGSRIPILEETAESHKIRFLEHKRYLIFYTIDQKDVFVLHVTGPGQDWFHFL